MAFSFQLFLDARIGNLRSGRYAGLGLTPRSVEVVDPDTVRFTFPSPTPDFATYLDFHVLPMHRWVPHTSTAEAATAYAALIDASGNYVGPLPVMGDAFDDGSETFGSGPYQAEAGGGVWDEAAGTSHLVHYAGSATPTRDVTRLTYRLIDGDTLQEQLAAGAAWVVDSVFWYSPDELDGLPATHAFVSTALRYSMAAYNASTAPTQDVLVRRAIDHVFPRGPIIDDLLGGVGIIARSYISPGSPWYDDEFGPGGSFGPSYDVAAARASMRAAGYTDLMSDSAVLHSKRALLCSTSEQLDSWTDDGVIDRATADRILADLARAGVGD